VSFETVTDRNTEQMLMCYIENIAMYVRGPRVASPSVS